MGQKIIKNRIFKNTWYNHSNQSDWKIAGIKTATFSGTPGNWGHPLIAIQSRGSKRGNFRNQGGQPAIFP